MLLAALGSFGLLRFDHTYGKAIVEAYPMFEMSPPAARSILSSIVSAMVSTTGVVFSITIVALSLASSQFGSRLIRTYRNRRTTHFTLGIFVSTSLFCILVLASIREVNDFNFVPTASVVVGMILTVICLGTLVYYIHDMSTAIQAPNVIQHSADDLDKSIQRLFPEDFGNEVPNDGQIGADESFLKSAHETLGQPAMKVSCGEVGYLQAIEDETVMAYACDNNMTVRLLIRPGDFLFRERDLAEIWIHDDETISNFEGIEDVRKQACEELNQSLIVGSERTHVQDIRYAFNELVDIAVRALSPGINDPFTAVNCVDRIHAALMLLKCRKSPSEYRLDDEGRIRVVAKPVSFDECVEGSLEVVAFYANENPMVSTRIDLAIESIERLHETVR